jgi:NAD(P)-dependent dehydrogenase (short-subunit alcohol dehydrogenase family)
LSEQAQTATLHRRYAGRVALITGAGNGIGKATAVRLADEGATVIVTDRAEAALATTAAQISSGGSTVVAYAMDVSLEEDWKRVIAAIDAEFGLLDLLVNNAGFSHVAMVTDYAVEDWRALHDTDLLGIFLGLKHSIPLLRNSDAPAIVNLASTMGLMGFPRIPAYSAAKGGVIALSRQVALDYAPEGIRVNAVCPGPTRTERLAGIVESGDVDESVLIGNVPLARWAQPSEIASVIAFLGSEDASYITGAAIPVDGGQTAH